jgi:hypothetical protein
MKRVTFITINYTLAVLTLISCLISITHNDIYRDGDWANAQWLGQDIVSLFIALPLLLVSLEKGRRSRDPRWEMLNGGILLYFTYTYSFYVFAARLSPMYLFHVPIYGLSAIGFVLSCLQLFKGVDNYDLKKTKLRMTIILYLVLIGLMIAFLWLSDIFAHLTDPGHRSETPNGEAPLIIYSLDLALIIPLMLASAFMLFRQSKGSHALTGIILTKTSTLGFALMAMSLSMYVQDLSPDPFLIILWSVIGCIGTLLTGMYLKNLIKE